MTSEPTLSFIFTLKATIHPRTSCDDPQNGSLLSLTAASHLCTAAKSNWFQFRLLWARNRIYSPSSWSHFSVRIRFKHLSLISYQILITDHTSVLLSDKHHPHGKSFLLGQEEAIESLRRPPITSSSASIIPSAALGLI